MFQNELMFGLETVSLSVKVDKECDFLNIVRVQCPAFMSIVMICNGLQAFVVVIVAVFSMRIRA